MQNQIGLIIELIYFILLVVLPALIYIRTKRIYDFSKHQGIKYFRNAFIFFSLIYFFRFIVLNLRSLDKMVNNNFLISLESLSMFLVIYFSLLSIFYLTASFSWKDLKFISDNFLHLAALFIASIIYFIKLPIVLLAFGIVIILFLILKAYFNYKYKNHKIFSKLFVIYTLLLIFWLFDLVPYTQQLLRFELKITGYIISVMIFVYINYKIKAVLNFGKKEE